VNERSNQQVVVVTGATSGIGRAIVQVLAARRTRLGLIARNEEALEATANEVRQAGGEALVLPVDVADAEAVERAAAAVEERWGRIDVWVNNAMATVFAPATETTAEEYHRVTAVTYLGVVHGTLAALRRMSPRDEGTIIQIGSALAYRSIPLQSAYCAAKAAVRGFTDSLRTELMHDGSRVRLCMLQLPAVNTPQVLRQRNKMPRQAQPMPPLFAPEAVADSVVWAIEHTPREMLIGGPTVEAVWGQKLFPALLDWYLARTGFEAQMADAPNEQHGRDILFAPLAGDPGARGPYRNRERGPDLQMRLRPHTRAIAAGIGLASLVVGARSTRRS
jgi:short-subunit dehydrogenase